MKVKFVFVSSLLLTLVGCKPDIPPTPVPLTKAVSGVEAPCESLTFGGFPRSEKEFEKRDKQFKGTFFICRPGYALNYDSFHKTSDWVVERLTSENLSKERAAKDISDHRPDPEIPPRLQSLNNDFIGTGYERVYLAPAEDFEYDDVLYSHSFYLSNAVHLHPSRVASWKNLAQQVRELAKQRGELFVVSGPIYEAGLGRGWVGTPDSVKKSSGKNGEKGKVMVPTHLFKVVIDPKTKVSAAYIIENTPTDHPTVITSSVAEVERLTGLVFAPDLTKSEQAALKTR